jgi:hypothetical protein
VENQITIKCIIIRQSPDPIYSETKIICMGKNYPTRDFYSSLSNSYSSKTIDDYNIMKECTYIISNLLVLAIPFFNQTVIVLSMEEMNRVQQEI